MADMRRRNGILGRGAGDGGRHSTLDAAKVGAGRHPLYAALLRHGAANAHVTDYVKSPGRVSDEWPDDLEADAELFEQEVAIVQPTLLVALGDRTFFTLRHFAAMRRIPLHLTMHYTRAVRFGLEGEFNRQIAVALAGATAR
jgi:hypothetical protein